jgi:hypothetical protein
MRGCGATFNDISVSDFEQYGYNVLDTTPVLKLRVDYHPCSPFEPHTFQSEGDCLHFCVSGPADTMLEAIQAEVLARERN